MKQLEIERLQDHVLNLNIVLVNNEEFTKLHGEFVKALLPVLKKDEEDHLAWQKERKIEKGFHYFCGYEEVSNLDDQRSFISHNFKTLDVDKLEVTLYLREDYEVEAEEYVNSLIYRAQKMVECDSFGWHYYRYGNYEGADVKGGIKGEGAKLTGVHHINMMYSEGVDKFLRYSTISEDQIDEYSS